jgi:hypothetical protein
MKTRTALLTSLLATGLALFMAVGTAMAQRVALGQARQEAAVCGPTGETLSVGARARVYRLERPRVRSVVLGCVKGHKPQRLDRPRQADTPWEGATQPWIDSELIALDAPWVAYVENFVNVDVGDKEVGVLNLRSGARWHCPIGPWSTIAETGFETTGIVVTQKGSAGWIGEERTLQKRRREVHACEGARRQILDEGPGIGLHSLRLHGITLSWTDAGAPRSAQLR